jgi:hypothetical protein
MPEKLPIVRAASLPLFSDQWPFGLARHGGQAQDKPVVGKQRQKPMTQNLDLSDC